MRTKGTSFGTGLFAFYVAVNLVMGVFLCIYFQVYGMQSDNQINALIAEQLILIQNVSALQVLIAEQTADIAELAIIIGIEQSEIQPISDKIDAINCKGIKTINGQFPDENRTFILTGDSGLQITVGSAPSTIIINASDLQNQYDAEQAEITTLLLMDMVTNTAIMVLDGEVVKSINTNVKPNVNTSNIDVSAICGTSVYQLSNGTFAIDMCSLQQNLTSAFDNISFNFNLTNMQLSQLEADVVVLENKTLTLQNNANLLYNASIFTINHAYTVNNNFDLNSGIGTSVNIPGSPTNEVIVGNTGLIGINHINSTVGSGGVANNFGIYPGYGTLVDSVGDTVTLRNAFYKPPCAVTVTGLSVLFTLPISPTFTPLPVNWLTPVMTPTGCYDTDILQPLTSGGSNYGIFYMPEGIWTLGFRAKMLVTGGGIFNFEMGISNSFYSLPFSVLVFNDRLLGSNSQLFVVQGEMTLSSLIYAVGTQFSIQYVSSSAPATTIVFNDWYAIRVV
jgi:hypothetical protein